MLCHASARWMRRVQCRARGRQRCHTIGWRTCYVMPPSIGCEGSNKELVECVSVTPWAGGHVVSCLRLLDVRNPTKTLRETSVSHHWQEDVVCHASAYWMRRVQQRACRRGACHTIGWRTCVMPPPIGREGSNKELAEGDGVTPLVGGCVMQCLRL